MDPLTKLKAMSSHMVLEPDGEPSRPAAGPPHVAPCGQIVPRMTPREKEKNDLGIFHAAMPGGKTIPLLKTLLTSACERDCYYCPFRAGRSYRRTSFKPEEMAKLFMGMVRAGLVEGLFLSSGIIKGGVTTQDKLLDTADIIRQKYGYRGYLHLKLMPGSEKEQVRRGMELASRLSINLEAPNERRLAQLAPQKKLAAELLRPLQWVEEIRQQEIPEKAWNGRWPSTTTQFVVGGAGESDLELLATSEHLLQKLHLQRVYYSTFQPVRDTPLEHLPPGDPRREHRLYQSSFLMRDYGFGLEEMPFTPDGSLPLDEDPKQAWAREHLQHRPVELNRAGREELLRVPGIGPRRADQILKARRQGKLRDLNDLRQLGLQDKRMAPYILLDGRQPARQLSLF